MKGLRLCTALCACVFASGIASAQPAAQHDASQDPQGLDSRALLGLNLRTELGTHPIRVNLGWRTDDVELSLVLDPMFWTDGQIDTDAWVSFDIRDGGAALLAGWRNTAIPISGGRQYHEKLLLGLAAPVEALSTGSFVFRVGFELSTVIAKHGGDLPTDYIGFSEPAEFLDLVNLAMFVRFDYETGL